MTLFQAVKERITTRQAAERYGIKVGRNGMCRCPFHNDRDPSMKADQRYYCFGCGCTGDVIDFTANLFGLDNVKAAMKLAEDFGVDYEYHGKSSGQTDKRESRTHPAGLMEKTDEQLNKKRLTKAVRAYFRYLNDLKEQKEKAAPRDKSEDFSPAFVQILSTINYVESCLDVLVFKNEVRQKEFLKEKQWEVDELAKRYGLS